MQEYTCPFCVSSWDCDGPHIENQKDLENFFERFFYFKEDLSLLAKEIVEEYSVKNDINLKDLEEIVYNKLINRQFT